MVNDNSPDPREALLFLTFDFGGALASTMGLVIRTLVRSSID